MRSFSRLKLSGLLTRVWLLLWGAIQFSIQDSHAEIFISKIESGPKLKELEYQTGNTSHGSSLLRIKNSSRQLHFHFHQKREPDEEIFRLRYKLDGYDDNWRDLLGHRYSSKVSIQFTDQLLKIVGTEVFFHEGETPGWKGSIETSPFVELSHQFTVPERAVGARVVLYGPLPRENGMGFIALDSCKLSFTNREKREIDLSLVEGADLGQPLGTPTYWSREGSEAELAVLRTIPSPNPHPVLAIEDTSATTSAIWATDRLHLLPVTPGDEITLSYRISHSLGSAGPSVAQYGRLEPGRYNFRVAAARSNGELTGEEISIPFDVLPPPHQRWQFWAVIVLAIVVALLWIRKLILTRAMQKERAIAERQKILEQERSRIARDLHDDIGAGLTEIAMQSDLVRQEVTSGTTEKALQRIESVCLSAIGLIRSVDEIVWAMNPANDTLDQFTNYLSQTTEEFLDAASIRVRFQIPSALPAVALQGKMRHNLYLVVREALNNLTKHASCDLVTLKVDYTNQLLKISVQDNGCGFITEETEALHSANNDGLTNMQNRMLEIGGNYQITSNPEKGTHIEFHLPIPFSPGSHDRTN